MKFYLLFSILLIHSSFILCFDNIQVHLVPDADNDDLTFQWVLSNTGDSPLHLLNLGLPDSMRHLPHGAFSLTPADPLLPPPASAGIRFKLPSSFPLLSPSQWRTIPPRANLSLPVDLSAAFRLQRAGPYLASFSFPLAFLAAPPPALPAALDLHRDAVVVPVSSAAPLPVFVSEAAVAASARLLSPHAQRWASTGCSAVSGSLSAIISNYVTGLGKCLQKLQAVDPTVQASRDAVGMDTWFGHYGAGAIGTPYDASHDNYYRALQVLTTVTNFANSGGFTVLCENCRDTLNITATNPVPFAYVYPTDVNRVIHMCNEQAFTGSFSLRIPDSVPGTLIHETTHFQFAGHETYATNDWIYGTAGCQSMVNSVCRTDLSRMYYCANNADTFEYFCESLGSQYSW